VGVQIEHGRYKGRLVIPAYHRTTADKSGPSNAHVFYSDDHGKSWRLGGDVGLHTNECQVVEVLEGGASQLLINARNHWGRSGKRPELAGVRIVARSQDGGAAWSPPAFDRTLIEPQCQASLVRFRWQAGDEKGCLLFANPASRGRNRMTVRASFDEGGTWPAQKLVYAGSAAYSCLCALPDGRIGLIYERDDYGKLTFTAFRLENLKQD
jgi:sialidase-1